jgi:hypothetical protein
MIVTCPSCNATCRIPAVLQSRLRCGGCKREFTPRELTNARPEPTPSAPAGFDADDDFDLDAELDVLDLEEDDE